MQAKDYRQTLHNATIDFREHRDQTFEWGHGSLFPRRTAAAWKQPCSHMTLDSHHTSMIEHVGRLEASRGDRYTPAMDGWCNAYLVIIFTVEHRAAQPFTTQLSLVLWLPTEGRPGWVELYSTWTHSPAPVRAVTRQFVDGKQFGHVVPTIIYITHTQTATRAAGT